jgi:hypothetical protein
MKFFKELYDWFVDHIRGIVYGTFITSCIGYFGDIANKTFGLASPNYNPIDWTNLYISFNTFMDIYGNAGHFMALISALPAGIIFIRDKFINPPNNRKRK